MLRLMLVVGLTGGIGSGKSTVSGFFSILDVPVIDTDVIAHQLVAPGQPALNQIADAFGPQLLDPSGQLDRKQLRALVFADEEKRQQLENILHPLIKAEVQRQIAQLNHPYCVVVVPLLVEKQWHHVVDRILVVDVPAELQRSRTQQRDALSDAQITAIIASQATREERLAAADDVIYNDDSLENVRAKVQALHLKYLELASKI